MSLSKNQLVGGSLTILACVLLLVLLSLRSDPRRFSSESGSTIEGDEYLDQFGTHHWYREPRPFSVSHESDHFQWTAEDGKRSEIIQQLANNSEMAKYLEKLNVMTEQRQLVYPKELLEQHAAEAFQGKRDTLTLPGFSGKEYQVKIMNVAQKEVENGVISNYLMGEVVGVPGSLVELVHENGYYHGSIQDGKPTSIEWSNRENGEWILSSLNSSLDPTGPCATGHTVNDVGATAALKDSEKSQ